ncbi:arrestin domain-containing protein 1a [Pholidichthys leucotaenia]
MGKLQAFQITFDQDKVVYSPGESISGTVTVKLSQALQCKAIKVNCNGFCGVTSKVNDTTWTEEEQYFNSTVAVSDKGTLKQGEHTFPFKFLIPATAPTSFEGNYGRIVFRVRAFIDTPKFSKDYNTEKPFYLLRLLNLNEIPEIWGPSLSEVTQQFSYMLVKTGTVVIKAQTDMKGYTPGQIIQVTASIHNQSLKSTGNMFASLIQRVTYETKKPTHDVKAIAEVEGGAVKKGKEVEWKEQIIVPALPQSSLVGCELIKIEYYIKVGLKFPDVMLMLPIHIGNVALDKKKQQQSTKKSPPPTEEALPAPKSSPPTVPPRPAVKPTPRPTPRSRASSHVVPSAPPTDYPDQGAEGGAPSSYDFPNKRQSQLVSPNAFSYAPGLFFPSQNQQPNGTVPSAPSGPAFTGSAGPTAATGLYPSISGPSEFPPPDYATSSIPQEAPPSYDESCNT